MKSFILIATATLLWLTTTALLPAAVSSAGDKKPSKACQKSCIFNSVDLIAAINAAANPTPPPVSKTWNICNFDPVLNPTVLTTLKGNKYGGGVIFAVVNCLGQNTVFETDGNGATVASYKLSADYHI